MKNILRQREIEMISMKERYYHSYTHHIKPMIDQIKSDESLTNEEKEILIKAAIYHDFILDPKKSDNEYNSAKLYLSDFNSNENDIVYKIIMSTKNHKNEENNKLIDYFLRLDLSSFEKSIVEILKDEKLIRKEYNFVDWTDYKNGRISILNRFKESIYLSNKAKENINLQIEFLKNETPNIAVFQGSFNPFHKGHLHILEKAEEIFDKVIVLFSFSLDKQRHEVNIPNCLYNRQVEINEGALSDWILKKEYPLTIIRGIRNITDCSFEQNYIKFIEEIMMNENRKTKVVNIFCDKSLEHISSSAIRQLQKLYPNNHEKWINYLP